MDGNTFIFEFEKNLMIWLQSLFGDAGLYIGSALTYLGESFTLIILLVSLFWFYDKELGKKGGVIIITAVVWNPLVKNIALRRRPYMDHPEIKCLKAPTNPDVDINDLSMQGYSFPSGHSTNSACVYGFFALVFKHRAFKILAVVLPFLVGLSRVMLGVHYPTDVLVGWLMGYGISFAMVFLYKRVKRQWLLHLIIFCISLIGVFYCRTDDYFTGLGVMAGIFLAIPFEEKFVKFEDTHKPLFCVIRVALGLGLFAGLNVLLKLPFSDEFLHSATMASFGVRFLRYFIIVFILLGVYPMLFKYIEKPRKKA